MKRQTINVQISVKRHFKDIKENLGLSESETLAYLIRHYYLHNDKLTKVQHDKIINDIKEMHNQAVMNI